jgi:hypothetical protein
MEEHVTIVGILRLGMGILGVAGALVIAVLLIGAGAAAAYAGDQDALPIMIALTVTIGLVVLLFSVPAIIGGIGVLKYKNWARYLVLVLSVFGLLSFPIGTVIAIYSIWVLTHKRTVSMFVPPPTLSATDDEVA